MVPFGILLIVNSLLVYETAFKKSKLFTRSERDKSKRRSLTMTVITLTFTYIILTGPNAVLTSYFQQPLIAAGLNFVVLPLMGSIRFLNHTCSFWILCATNAKFSSEVKSVVFFRRTNNSTSLSTQRTKP